MEKVGCSESFEVGSFVHVAQAVAFAKSLVEVRVESFPNFHTHTL